MIKKTITYSDYDGNERTEDFYFNLTEAESVELELSVTGGLTSMISRIVAAQDNTSIIAIVKDFILKSYGEKSPDGRKFVKIDDNGHRLVNDFMQTEAYSKLFMELATDADAAAKFINGIIPSKRTELNPVTK